MIYNQTLRMAYTSFSFISQQGIPKWKQYPFQLYPLIKYTIDQINEIAAKNKPLENLKKVGSINEKYL